MKDIEFKNAINICQDGNIVPLYSIINFDLWLLIHKSNFMGQVNTVKGYQTKIRTEYGLSKTADICGFFLLKLYVFLGLQNDPKYYILSLMLEQSGIYISPALPQKEHISL